MPVDDPKLAGLLLLVLVAVIGLVGVVVVMLLMRSWMRYDRRLRNDSPSTPSPSNQPPQDIWSISGQRLTQDMPDDPPRK